jgi:hypothetical protein
MFAKIFSGLSIIALTFSMSGCDIRPTSDQKQQKQQEVMLQQMTDSVGMPNIKNGRERRLLKDIIEMRDSETLVTYTYLFSEQIGKLTFLCNSIGYGIPAATQYTNPMKVDSYTHQIVLPQADPNGLFSPSSAEGTWVMCVDPKKAKPVPTYIEPRIVTSTYQLQ